MQKYYYWTLLEISLFFSYIYSIVVYVTLHMLSPFSVYQFYLTKAITNPELNWSVIFKDRKPTE